MNRIEVSLHDIRSILLNSIMTSCKKSQYYFLCIDYSIKFVLTSIILEQRKNYPV